MKDKEWLEKLASKSFQIDLTNLPEEDQVAIKLSFEQEREKHSNSSWGIGIYWYEIEHGEKVIGYGYYQPENPHDFAPDKYSCSDKEISAWKTACLKYDLKLAQELSDELLEKLNKLIKATGFNTLVQALDGVLELREKAWMYDELNK